MKWNNQRKDDTFEDIGKMSVSDVVETLDILKIREYAEVFPGVPFKDALSELFPALGERIKQNPHAFGMTRAEVKKGIKEAKEYNAKKYKDKDKTA